MQKKLFAALSLLAFLLSGCGTSAVPNDTTSRLTSLQIETADTNYLSLSELGTGNSKMDSKSDEHLESHNDTSKTISVSSSSKPILESSTEISSSDVESRKVSSNSENTNTVSSEKESVSVNESISNDTPSKTEGSHGNTSSETVSEDQRESSTVSVDEPVAYTGDKIDFGSETLRGFLLDNVYHSENNGDIYYCSYIPESYDGSKPYALFITLPGWEGLHFQGVGENIRWENFGITAQDYNDEMIIIAPQLNDWGESSADQTIALTEYLLDVYNIDDSRVYLEGYSGGGETGSIVICKRPELYTACLIVSSQWDGDLNVLVESETPVYMATGENDSYYGSQSLRNAYSQLHGIYRDKGLTDSEIDKILVLDLKQQDYFSSRGVEDQHAGGGLFADDESIMGWLFGEH